MTQFLHWAVIVFKNMFSMLFSMTDAPQSKVTTCKVVIEESNLWERAWGKRGGISVFSCVSFIKFYFFNFLPCF